MASYSCLPSRVIFCEIYHTKSIAKLQMQSDTRKKVNDARYVFGGMKFV